MQIITITIDDIDRAIDVWAACAHRYGLDNVTINSNGLEPAYTLDATEDDYVDPDPTPPQGIKRKKPDVISVPCPTCGAAAGQFCASVTSGKSWASYNNGHADRKRARDAAWKAQA